MDKHAGALFWAIRTGIISVTSASGGVTRGWRHYTRRLKLAAKGRSLTAGMKEMRAGEHNMTDQSIKLQEAAVLVPVYRGAGGELRLVIIRRSGWGVHGGQLAFPGGKAVPADKTFVDTALREAREEVGINPDEATILDELPVVDTVTTGFRIYPFLARIVAPLSWRREEREVAEIFEVRVRDLADPAVHGEETRWYPVWPKPRRVPFYRVGAHKLWGATYRILHPLLPRLVAREWPL